MMTCKGQSNSSLFFFQCYGDPRDLHSFPTRRSSDLADDEKVVGRVIDARAEGEGADELPRAAEEPRAAQPGGHGSPAEPEQRSEEHTSELQSHVNLVCRLLLEKKKKQHHDHREAHAQ